MIDSLSLKSTNIPSVCLFYSVYPWQILFPFQNGTTEEVTSEEEEEEEMAEVGILCKNNIL